MSKLISRKGIVLIVIPLFTIFIQGFIRYIMKLDFNTIGITFGALGLGQIFPFFYFDHFIANKVLGISPTYVTDEKELKIIYKLTSNITDTGKIDDLKNLFFISIFVNLTLFTVILYLGFTGHIFWHIFFGVISCFSSWYLLIYK